MTLSNELRTLRRTLRQVTFSVEVLKDHPDVGGEVLNNLILAYRHLQDASFRLGQARIEVTPGLVIYDE